MTPSLYHIPPSLPFLETLAHGLWQRYGHTPEAMANVRLLLPNQRSARALEHMLYHHAGSATIMLPQIFALGDAAALETLLLDTSNITELLTIPPVISPYSRRLQLMQRVVEYHQQYSSQRVTHEHALRLATALETLLDDMARYDVPAHALQKLVPEELAQHWQETLSLLEIITQHWPAQLQHQKMQDTTPRLHALTALLCEAWQHTPPPYPVIAAGSTASLPTTAQLLETIAHLPQGAVILPNLDTHLHHPPPASHPQYHLRQFLTRCQMPLNAISQWTVDHHHAHTTLAHAMFQPVPEPITTPLPHLHWLEAASSYQEAQIIALLLRETIETPGAIAALVTPDQQLAETVAALMRRWDIVLDSSMGMPLLNTPPANFLCLLAEMASSGITPVSLLAVLKHPFCTLGMERVECLRFARHLEHHWLRGTRRSGGLPALLDAARQAQDTDTIRLLETFSAACTPLLSLLSMSEVPLSTLITTLLETAERCAAPTPDALWQRADGAMVHEHLSAYHPHATMAIYPPQFPAMLRELLADATYRPPAQLAHPQLHILTPIEARLLHADTVILAGLNQGVWPATPHNPWLSRSMMETLGLPGEDHAVSLAAHDISSLICLPKVILTRATRDDRAPTVASPFWQRLKLALGEHWPAQQLPAHYTQWAGTSSKSIPEMPTTAPCPPLSARPTTLAATDIELLVQDPFAFYSKKILKLRPLDAIDEDPSAKDFGTILHKVCEDFTKADPHGTVEEDRSLLHQLLSKTSTPLTHNPLFMHFWQPTMLRALDGFLQWHRQVRPHRLRSFVETTGQTMLNIGNTPFTITAKADRIDVFADHILITDYKSGTMASDGKILSGEKCQLLIQAWIAARGGFADVPSHLPIHVQFGNLSGKAGEAFCAPRLEKDLPTHLEACTHWLTELLAHYHYADVSYRSPAELPHTDDYHLLRRTRTG